MIMQQSLLTILALLFASSSSVASFKLTDPSPTKEDDPETRHRRNKVLRRRFLGSGSAVVDSPTPAPHAEPASKGGKGSGKGATKGGPGKGGGKGGKGSPSKGGKGGKGGGGGSGEVPPPPKSKSPPPPQGSGAGQVPTPPPHHNGGGNGNGEAVCSTLAVEFYTDDISIAGFETPSGQGLRDLPFYDAKTGEELGFYSDFATDLGNQDCIASGAFSFTSDREIASTINVAFTCFSEENAIVGGTGEYGCASGYETVEAGNQDTSLSVNLVVCGPLCKS